MASTIKVDNVQNQPGTNVINKCGTTVNVGAASDNIRSAGNNLQASDGGNLISQSGTDITLGASGDTIALASGASQTGFGRTGTVDWITTPKVTGDSPVTGVSGSGYFLNTTAGTITINLPAGAAGSIVSMADYAGTWQTNNVTVNANGTEKIGGVASVAVTLNTEGQSVTLVYVDSTQGWVNTMDSTSNVRAAAFMIATVSGACNTLTTAPCCADTKTAIFLGPGTFCVSAAASCAADNLVSYVTVAGGGAGGSSGGGGGGAGGFREVISPSAPYTGSPLDGYGTPGNRVTVTATGFPITVGAGGTRTCNPGSVGSRGNSGNNSVFSTTTSAGGGGGGARDTSTPSVISDGASGGAGGGGSWDIPGSGASALGGVGNTPPVTPSQGFSGGYGRHVGATHSMPGGGGGSGAVGASQNPSPPYGTGNGGAGVTSSVTGSPVARGGGGAGCGNNGTGGTGGGGNQRVAGTVNTGGGGGGGGNCNAGGGGSGVVIIRYKFQ